MDAVLLDYGGVLTNPVRESIEAWLAADDIEPASFSRTLRSWLSRNATDGSPIHRLETGHLLPEDFETILAAELVRVDGGPVEPAGILARLFARMRPDPVMLRLATDLARTGVRVGLVSNSWGVGYPRDLLSDFHPLVISHEVRLRKPSAAIFQLAIDQLGLPAHRVAFVDDAEVNVLGARAVGLHAIQHTSAPRTRAALASLVPRLHDVASDGSATPRVEP